MSHTERPLVVGAGPVGLAAALFLAKAGRPPRIIDGRHDRSPHSRALAVNPRTLTLLESTGVTERMLSAGERIIGVQFGRRTGVIARIEFKGIHPKYPFMVALSQARSEEMLEDALAAQGTVVERGTSLVACAARDGRVEAQLATAAGGREVVECPWLLAADGSHSTARAQMKIAFEGSVFARDWHLVDVPLRTSLDPRFAHIFFLKGGVLLFLIRVVDEQLKPLAPEPIWRVLSSRPAPLTWLVNGEPAGPPLWESAFRVSHRLAATFAVGEVHLAGDAAHIHSPVGARGMNLGIEDAAVFAALEANSRRAEYGALRRPVDRAVVRTIELISRMASAETPLFHFVRSALFPILVRAPLVRHRMVKAATGLDHELPFEPHRVAHADELASHETRRPRHQQTPLPGRHRCRLRNDAAAGGEA